MVSAGIPPAATSLRFGKIGPQLPSLALQERLIAVVALVSHYFLHSTAAVLWVRICSSFFKASLNSMDLRV